MPSTIEYSESQCAICEKSSDGKHFGVESCRACAAFYRRSLVNHGSYVCRRQVKYCTPSALGVFCKWCRYQKCLRLGMGQGKSVEEKKVQSRYEQRVIYKVIDSKSQKICRFIDVRAIMKRSIDVLKLHSIPEATLNMNTLHKMVFALKSLRAPQSSDPLIVKSMLFRDFFYLWETHMIRCAEWLMFSEEFRRLPEHERIEMFKLVWAVWRRIERYTMSAKIFGKKCYDEKMLLLSHDMAGRHDDFQLDLSEVYTSSHDSTKKMFSESVTSYYEDLVKPYLSLELTTTEVTFILCQVTWQYAGRRLQGQTLEAAERFLARISEDLHSYYQKDNYATRLAKMMKIVNAVLAIQMKQETLMDMVCLFDLFNLKLSDPSFFCV